MFAVWVPALFVFLWCSGYLVGDIGTSAAPPFALLFWRFAVATTVLAAVAVAMRAPWPRTPKAWGHLLVTGVLLQTVQFGGVYVGLTLGVSAGLASLIISVSPLAIAAAAVPLFAERMSGRQWVGLLIGLGGVGLAVSSELSGAGHLLGLLAVVAGAAGFTAGTLYQKRFGATMDLRTGGTIQSLGATLTTIPIAMLNGGLALPVTATAIGSTAWLAVINSIGGFTFLFLLLRSRGGGAATSYLFLVPPVTALIAVPLLGQPLLPGAVAGIALSAVGVALVTRGTTPSRDKSLPAAPEDVSESAGVRIPS